MGGPQFGQPVLNDKTEQTVAVSDRPKIEHINATQSGTIGPGDEEEVEIYAPSGSVYFPQAIHIRCEEIPDATTGFQWMIFFTSGGVKVASGRASFDNNLIYQYQSWASADVTQQPEGDSGQARVPSALAATENQPIRFRYFNETDHEQPEDRTIELTVKEVSY